EQSSRRLLPSSSPSTKSSGWTATARLASAASNRGGCTQFYLSNMKAELRLTDTNAASDSKGRTWGLEGGLFWWLIGGIGAGITLFFVLLVVVGSSLGVSFLVALVPVLVCLAYIFGLRQGKPPGYDRDIFEYVVNGRGFSPEVHRSCNHPLL